MPAAVCLENQQGLARWFCTAGPLARCAGMSESDAGVDEPDSVKVFKCTAIRAPGLKSTWLPAVQTVAGDEYIKLSKWDRHLTHFVTSKPLNLHAGGGRLLNNINVQWFEDMCSLRLQACNAAVKQVIEQAADAEGVPRPTKIRAATQEDEFLCGRTIVVSAPAVVGPWVFFDMLDTMRLHLSDLHQSNLMDVLLCLQEASGGPLVAQINQVKALRWYVRASGIPFPDLYGGLFLSVMQPPVMSVRRRFLCHLQWLLL